ncbi:putative Saccharopine dehydrogenase [Tothia fuscella]|uniref:Saccharopine dehydrogenase [NADP(+), L-glutamate-forming] n=1 Tax=Tothia fuscella TaxID=1048955 RepID=A0A9P4TVJ9_9PEZI|nr:putative Saccharopine dehydrogenase [Tothia fuscella]
MVLSRGRNALLLGSGFVATPTVDVLDKAGIKVTIACRTLEKAKKMAEGFKNASAIALDVNDEAALDSAVSQHDVTISLIPYTFHAQIIKAGIKAKKNVVTTSYVSPAMMELDAEAKEAGITVMNEIGLDPGLDHLYAVKTIDEVHKAGGRVTSFISYCGGLPAAECSDNPLGYKFSWSSRGVLLAAKNNAKFYKDGKIEEVSGEELMGVAKPYHTGYQGYALVAYPNRDSTPYRQRYAIPEANTIIRGTLRYAGNPEFVKVLVDMGFFSDVETDYLKGDGNLTWKEFTAKLLGSGSNAHDDLVWAISSKSKFADTAEKNRIIEGLSWIGVFSDELVNKKGNPLDTLCAVLEKKMAYEEGERDLVILQHRFEIENQDGSKETRTSTLVENGDPKGYSAMAKLVGIPCGVAVLHVLDGKIKEKGILAPMDAELNKPIMDELKEKYGIFLVEKTL